MIESGDVKKSPAVLIKALKLSLGNPTDHYIQSYVANTLKAAPGPNSCGRWSGSK